MTITTFDGLKDLRSNYDDYQQFILLNSFGGIMATSDNCDELRKRAKEIMGEFYWEIFDKEQGKVIYMLL